MRANIIRREQQWRLALRDHSEGRRHIGLGHVVVRHVVTDDVAESRDAFGLAQGLGDRIIETRQAGDVHVVEARELHLGQGLAGRPFDGVEEVTLARRDKADRSAASARPSGAADAVHVRLGVNRDVVVDDVTDSLDVEAAGGDIRCYQNVELARLELLDRTLTLRLDNVTVDRRRRIATRTQLLGERLRLVLGAGEHDHPLEILDLEDAGERVDLLRIRHHQVALCRVRRGRCLVFDRDLRWIIQVLLRDPSDRRGHGGREEPDLFVIRGVGEDCLDILGETHLEHLVGLVEHQVLELGQVEGALFEVVHDAARRADHDVYPAPQC